MCNEYTELYCETVRNDRQSAIISSLHRGVFFASSFSLDVTDSKLYTESWSRSSSREAYTAERTLNITVQWVGWWLVFPADAIKYSTDADAGLWRLRLHRNITDIANAGIFWDWDVFHWSHSTDFIDCLTAFRIYPVHHFLLQFYSF